MVNRARLIILAALCVPVVIIASAVVIYDLEPVASSPNAHFTTFTVSDKTYKFTSVATNQTELAKGLMGAKVTSTTFELFVFPTSGYYSFWMYDVNSSLDIMWLNTSPGSDSGSFVYLALDVPPCHVSVLCATYQPSAKANYVIEAQAGFATAAGIKVGTPVTLG